MHGFLAAVYQVIQDCLHGLAKQGHEPLIPARLGFHSLGKMSCNMRRPMVEYSNTTRRSKENAS